MSGKGTQYGLGVMIRPTKIGSLPGHDGGIPGYTSTMGYVAEPEISAAFMFNSEGRQALNRPAVQVMVRKHKQNRWFCANGTGTVPAT